MSTEPATTEPDEPGGRADGTPDAGTPEAEGTPDERGTGATAATDDSTPEDGETGETTEATGATGEAAADAQSADGASDLSEAQAELAAQKLERERIERRKAEKKAPITAGAKLSGTAADLLAAVRAVEGGQKPSATVFAEPEPVPRRPAPEPVRRPEPVAAPVAAAPSGETVGAVRAVLAEGGAPESLAPQVAEALGEGAGDRLREDPWQLLRVVGVRPEQADGFARALLGAECGPDDERRGRAVTVWLLEQAAVAGHTALEVPALTAALAQRAVPDPDEAVQSAVAEGEALIFQDALDDAPPAAAATDAEDDEEEPERPVRVLVGLERYALAEESLADGLARIVNSLPKDDTTDWASAAASAPRPAAELIRAVAGAGLVLHTGGEAARAEPAALVAAARSLGLRAYAAT
ncbi:helix-hairpin-helix domain-containing protein, partial [Streptomyces neyagawaensis]